MGEGVGEGVGEGGCCAHGSRPPPAHNDSINTTLRGTEEVLSPSISMSPLLRMASPNSACSKAHHNHAHVGTAERQSPRKKERSRPQPLRPAPPPHTHTHMQWRQGAYLCKRALPTTGSPNEANLAACWNVKRQLMQHIGHCVPVPHAQCRRLISRRRDHNTIWWSGHNRLPAACTPPHLHTHAHTQTHVHTHKRTFTHIHTRLHTHTFIHTRTLTSPLMGQSCGSTTAPPSPLPPSNRAIVSPSCGMCEM